VNPWKAKLRSEQVDFRGKFSIEDKGIQEGVDRRPDDGRYPSRHEGSVVNATKRSRLKLDGYEGHVVFLVNKMCPECLPLSDEDGIGG
jgi:hypothetical protein